MLTPEREKEIRERCSKASPGPWQATTSWVNNHAYEFAAPMELIAEGPIKIRSQNAHFIAHAREDIPVLLAEIDRLRNDYRNALQDTVEVIRDLEREKTNRMVTTELVQSQQNLDIAIQTLKDLHEHWGCAFWDGDKICRLSALLKQLGRESKCHGI